LAVLADEKQSQIKFTAENAEIAEQKGICANGCSIKKYLSTSYFSAVFANSAVKEKSQTKPIFALSPAKNS